VTASEPRRVLVLVGTDHHRFDRLVEWVDRWLADRPGRAEGLVQHGTSRPPRVAEGKAYLAHEEVEAALHRADVVVSHGGPATIAEARRTGHRPVVVPRDGSRGEHVDDHQLRFARRLGREGLVRCVETEADLRTALDESLGEAERRVEGPDRAVGDRPVAAGVARLGQLVDRLVRPPGAPTGSAPRVAYLGGFGRSGSTLLERLLAEVPGVSAAGEVVHLWERGLRDDERCGCGLRFSDCEHWRKVGELAFGGWSSLDVEHVLELKKRVDRTRHVPRLAAPAFGERHARDLAEYADLYRRVYRAVAEVSGCEVVVDASKHASLAFVLSSAADIDLRVLHVVRDSRGVAHSWAKQVRRTEVVDAETFMPRYSPLRSAALWTAHNALFGLLDGLRGPVHRVRYEDLLASPRASLTEILGFLGLAADDGALDFLGSDSAELSPSHTIGGNPMRFDTGRLTLRRDDAWRRDLPPSARRTVAAVTALPLRRYGYDLRAGR
jgi:UDP-N-acetylglucosamine transferase subunit ALG13